MTDMDEKFDQTVSAADGEQFKTDIQQTVVDVEPGNSAPTYYSKLSVTLMVIFSGLAIGSDG